MEEQKLASSQVISKLFGNVETILNVNKELLVQLHPAKENIGRVFLNTAPFLKLYSVYAFNYKNVLDTLQVKNISIIVNKFENLIIYYFRIYQNLIQNFIALYVHKNQGQMYLLN